MDHADCSSYLMLLQDQLDRSKGVHPHLTAESLRLTWQQQFTCCQSIPGKLVPQMLLVQRSQTCRHKVLLNARWSSMHLNLVTTESNTQIEILE